MRERDTYRRFYFPGFYSPKDDVSKLSSDGVTVKNDERLFAPVRQARVGSWVESADEIERRRERSEGGRRIREAESRCVRGVKRTRRGNEPSTTITSRILDRVYLCVLHAES